MSKEQIEEMARKTCRNYQQDGNCASDYEPCDLECVYGYCAERIYCAGYRKQSEGEWVTNAWDGKKWIIIPYKKHEHIGAHCSVCNKRALLNYDKDEVTSNFCPNCGARMKGADND